MAHDPVADDSTDAADRPSREERVETARAVVYDDAGELIDAEDLDDALRAYGVDVGESSDGYPEYRNVPRELSLSVCHLAVDLRKDPAELIADREQYPVPDGSE